MIPSRQNTEPPNDPNEPDRQLEFTFWMLERAIDQMGPGVECVFKMSILTETINIHFDVLQKSRPFD